MRNRFDQLAKQIGREALARSGVTFIHDEISPETQHADLRHEPDPRKVAERARLGLLGRLADVPCILEIFAHAPSAEELRACLAKHLAFWRQRARRAKGKGSAQPSATIDPFLWIISAGTPAALLTGLALTGATGWPPGVYLFGDQVLRVGLVAANELPRDRDTLLVRLMAGGPLLRGAIEDLAELPDDALEQSVAADILLGLQRVLGQTPSLTPEEQEVIEVMSELSKAIAALRNQGRVEGRNEGRVEARANDVLLVLRVRGIAVPETARARILAQRDPEQLARWLEKAVVATSLPEVIDDPS